MQAHAKITSIKRKMNSLEMPPKQNTRQWTTFILHPRIPKKVTRVESFEKRFTLHGSELRTKRTVIKRHPTSDSTSGERNGGDIQQLD
ncbi:hypothetical protein EVAR_71905_1 [Eumeta japonica]|uniref:Uncharacterized protein n=1 Tax=Eumeta variegata TaxID=151549 RepID=A0A4C1SNV8_EUMVA|nr:hypothetical protein EVAR_71905_1 [Eumeta japonica]